MTKAKIVYPVEFRDKCFNNLRFYMDIRLLIAAMDYNHDNVVRYYLEEALEDSELYAVKGKVAEEKIHAHTVRQELYNEYMELLLNEEPQEHAGTTGLLSKRGDL